MLEKIVSNNLDANESAFFAREINHVKAKTFDVKYPALKAKTLIPVSIEAGPGAEVITYQQFNAVGIMKVIANYADDLPRSDVYGKEFSARVKSLGGAYGYSLQDVRASAMANRPLSTRKASAVKKASEQAENRIAWFGDATSGLLGLLSQPNVPSAVVAVGATTGNTRWIGASPKNSAEILVDLNNAISRIANLTYGAESPNTVLLPISQFRKISTTPLQTGSDTTILEFFKKNNPQITLVDYVGELASVNPAPSGGATADVMITYDRSPEVLSLEIPQPFEQLPVQERNLEFVVNCHSRIGGVIVYFPLAIDIAEGI